MQHEQIPTGRNLWSPTFQVKVKASKMATKKKKYFFKKNDTNGQDPRKETKSLLVRGESKNAKTP